MKTKHGSPGVRRESVKPEGNAFRSRMPLEDSQLSERLKRIYESEKRDFIYSVFLRVKRNVEEKYLMEPKGLPHEFYSLATVKFRHSYWKGFNPLRIDHLDKALKMLEEKGAHELSFHDLWRLYRMLGVPDESAVDKIRKNGLDWYVDQVNSKAVHWATTEDGYVGRYIYRKWDCYDFLTALLFAVEHDYSKAIDVRDSGLWKTTDSIFNYGYDWFHASFGPEPWAGLKEGMILYAKKCSPISRTRDHWGIVVRMENGLFVMHRTGQPYPQIDELRFFYRYSNRKEEKPVHVYYPNV
ncbi:hypothetical protein J7K41_02055 [Candidatus Micrarchaeota archaeon]|nr:hypothetical protein [Candidatus Micrarchaeota archaeon]